jgi:hypothetical protein
MGRGRWLTRAWPGFWWLPLLASGAVACSSHNVKGTALDVERDTTGAFPTSTVIGNGPITVGDFEYKGTNGGLQSRWPPATVQVTVRIKYISSHTSLLDVLSGNCAVRVRIYSADALARSAGQVAKISPKFDAVQSGSCYVPITHKLLTAGDSTTLVSAGSGPGVRLQSGRYMLTGIITVVPPADSLRHFGVHLIEVPAGSIRVPVPYD